MSQTFLDFLMFCMIIGGTMVIIVAMKIFILLIGWIGRTYYNFKNKNKES